MDASTKNRQSPQTLARMAREAFGRETANIREMDGGFCNAVYLFCFPQGDEAVLKIGPRADSGLMGYEQAITRTEVMLLETVARETAIPAPRVLHADFSGSLLPEPWFFMTRLPGMPLDQVLKTLRPGEESVIRHEVGALNRQLNNLSAPAFGMPGLGWTESTNSALMRRLFRLTLADAEKFRTELGGVTCAELYALVERAAPALDRCVSPVYVHWDLWEGNVFVENGHVSGLIDFERGIWGDPLLEHECSSFCVPSPDWLAGWGRGEFTPEEDARCSVYRLYRFLIMLIECDARRYPTRDQYNWVMPLFQAEVRRLRLQ